jgi:hypothetical protein
MQNVNVCVVCVSGMCSSMNTNENLIEKVSHYLFLSFLVFLPRKVWVDRFYIFKGVFVVINNGTSENSLFIT